MRISQTQRSAILESVAKELGKDAIVYLFGSRLDDTKKGGDIDLFIDLPAKTENLIKKKLKILTAIQRRIGEQKIDLIITYPDEFEEDKLPLIIKIARGEGARL